MRLILTTLIFIATLTCLAQPGYKIQFKVKGLKDTTAYLGYYYGESTFIKDTAKVDALGNFTFDGKQTLPQGVYFLVMNKIRLFEMVVGTNQRFSLTTSTDDYVKNIVVTGDQDNKLFFENMIFNMERHKEAEPFIKVLQDSTLKEDQKKNAREAYNKINDKVMAYQDNVITKYPGTITAKIFKANKPVKIPDAPKLANGAIDSTFQLRWYRQHFFDNFDLADDAMIRMPRPMYQEKINEYLDKLYAPIPDSLKKAIEFVISKAKKNQETYKYAVWICVIKYQTPEIMGLDEVYVHLYDKFFATGEMNFWVNEKLNKNLKDHADRLRKSLVGKTGPNLIMQDSNFKPKSMYDIKNRYTILFIFDPDCGHCKEETPKLVNFYNTNKKKFDVEVFAVSADTSMAKMRDYIKEMKMPWITVNGPRTYVGPYSDLYDALTTPSLYVLDSRKKIIGKKIPAEKLEDFLTHYEKIEKNKATAGKL
ncbi:thioredoxin-like domain-containing protein [Chryseosolibacter indicus]|uniref:TlpA family protein disulfide reductase n=1 Tax=Chryseosolibacter indicus TaxID=2782351 RepID=A0ABS5W037_9BACT|nr:thioredoxin-like domain-containing protein [Chryseosolibacter indicus]MBT1706529.1 TlpA family protein disulfide reductase [Chryseosolibacter indicus]